MIFNPKTWQALSSVLLVVFIAALLIGPGIPQWGWLALLGSGVAFTVELVLRRRSG